jgi:DNA-binding MarR family transcriptional regulator
MLDEREFELVNIIGAELGANQRDLSKLMDLSLGQTNMLIKRLVSKGYIRISQLNKKKVQYLLTPKGFTEKMNKSIKYTLKTINSLSLINNKLTAVLQKLIKDGHRHFVIVGESDLAHMVEAHLKHMDRSAIDVSFMKHIPLEKMDAYFLLCREDAILKDNPNEGQSVNLIEELARDEQLLKEIT